MATFTNRATLTYAGGATNSNIVTGELVEALTVTKTAVSATYNANGTTTYAVNLINTGTIPYTGLTVTDNLGAFEPTVGGATVTPLSYNPDSVRYFVNGTLQATPAVTAGPPLVVTGISVPAGGNALILYEVQTNGFAPLAVGDTITNTATVTGGGLNTPITADAVVTAEEQARLAIQKSLSPATVQDGGTLTYTFDIQNSGNRAVETTDAATVTDTFDPILSDIVVTLGGVILTENTDYTYNEATGAFATVPGRITVPAATFETDPVTGVVTPTPGSVTLTVSGTV